MTLDAIQLALCRFTYRHLMEPEQRVHARNLARWGDGGDENANEAFVELVRRVLKEHLDKTHAGIDLANAKKK